MMIRKLIKQITPNLLIKYYRLKRYTKQPNRDIFWKTYPSWAEAEKNADGYNNQNIIEKVRQSTLQVRDKIFPYERDSVLFDKIQYSWPLLSILQKIALENNNTLTIVDFGGSLGSTYFQNRDWLSHFTIKWIVVEQPHFVEIGRKDFSNHQLIFEPTIDDAFSHNPSTIIFSSVLQYLKSPEIFINSVIKKQVKNMLIDRTGMAKEIENDLFTLQTVPPEIYEASYPCRFFKESNFLAYFNSAYRLITDFESYCDPSYSENGITFFWKGYYFIKN